MKKIKSSKPEKIISDIPEWYWKAGLHDAYVTKIESRDFDIDFSEPKENRVKNALSLKIDTSNAMFDPSVKEIILLNYKIISGHIDMNENKKLWWLDDRLEKIDHDFYHYVLHIDFEGYKSNRCIYRGN